MCNEIDTSNWPQPGETWIARNGTKYGPLTEGRTGCLEFKGKFWSPSGSWTMSGFEHHDDLITRVVKLPEPIERFINVYPGKVEVIYAYDDAFQAKRCVSANGKTFRARITFLEEVK